MKSVIMALFLMSVALGNFFTAAVNSFIQVPNQLDIVTSLNTEIHAKDKNGQKLIDTQEEIIDIISQAKDLQGNSIQYAPTATGEYTLSLTGENGKLGSSSDIMIKFDENGNQIAIRTAEEENLNTAFGKIKSYFESNNNTLPNNHNGTKLIDDIVDNWGSSLQYRLVNRNSFRITSLGADKIYMTENDIILLGSISRPKTDNSKKNKPYSWREQQIIKLKGEEGIKEVEKGRGSIDEISFDTATMVGGQTSLEGADYFWFFTKLMLGTAFIFFFGTFFYTPKEYLHEEV